MMDARHRYPWEPEEEQFLLKAMAGRVPHKMIARELQRTPRAIDEQVARLKERGLAQ
jgi:Mn-dependent DtxR family transcriptional regulator